MPAINKIHENVFIIAGSVAWVLTFSVGFIILAPQTDDGYYTISAMGTAINGSPGFWIGDDFAPTFFLPTAFTYLYGLLLKLTMISGLEFGAFGFRVYQFLFIFLVPVVSFLALRRIFQRDYGIRFFILITGLLVTHFTKSAPTVRPEIIATVLFILFLSLRQGKFAHSALPAFVLALSGTMHPNFMILAITVFLFDLIRNRQLIRANTLKRTLGSIFAFALPLGVLAIYYFNNLSEYQQQISGRASIINSNIWDSPVMMLNDLFFWNDTEGIIFGLYIAYAALSFLVVMLTSTILVWRKRSQVWQQEKLWLCLPMLLVQWVVFIALPNFLPYLALSSLLAILIIVLLWQHPLLWVSSKRMRYVLLGAGFALCMIYVGIHSGKSIVSPSQRLTPLSLHTAMSVVLDDPEAIFYTNANRLIAPLIDDFEEEGKIRVNLTYLDPDCLPPYLLELASEHALKGLPAVDPHMTYWGFNKSSLAKIDNGELRYTTKGAPYSITIIPDETVYEDNRNLIVRASSITVKTVQMNFCE